MLYDDFHYLHDSFMHRRINIYLPEQTVQLLDSVAPRGDRSRFIDHAVRHYIEQVGRARLRRQLAEGYRHGAQEDLEIAAEWFPIEEEAWPR